MTTPQVMLAHLSLKHIHQRLVSFFRFVQLSGIASRKLCTALFRHLVLSLRFLLSRLQILCEKQWRNVSPSSSGLNTKPKIDGEPGSTINIDGQSQQPIIDEQIIIPLNNVACSLFPSIVEPHDGSLASSSSSQTLDAVLQSPEMLSPKASDDGTTPSFHVSDDSNTPIYTTQRHFVTSPTFETRRPHHQSHRLRGYRSDSTESTDRLGPGEISRLTRDMTLVAGSSQSFDLSTGLSGLSHEGTTVSSPTCGQATPALSPDDIFPFAPEKFLRHEKRRKIPEEATMVTMSPFLRDFSDYDDIPGWSTCTHPEGAPYFHNAAKRIFTDADLYDPACFKKIMEAIRIIENEKGTRIPEEVDLVLDLNVIDDGREIVDYYFADHEKRIILFVDNFESESIPHWSEIKGISSGTHLRQALETQYWWHCSAYPNCIELSDNLICKLRDMVMYFIIDCRTSPYANSPYTLADLQEILVNMNSLKDNVGTPYTSGCISFLIRLMFDISIAKFLNFDGQPEARLNRDDSVYGHSTNRRTWFIKSISIFLFSAPDIHLETLQKMWVDGMMHETVWEEGLKKVTDEWQEFILYSTVMLNANVAFLSIQSVDTGGRLYRSPAQISSYCSIAVSIGSIILGLILVRQSRTKHRETTREVREFLKTWTHPSLGLETLAIMFSLPYALLMWGMVSFLIAFGFLCLQDSGIASRSVTATLCGIMLILTLWCIWTSWRKQEPSNAENPKRTILTFEEERVKQKRKGFTFERANPDTKSEPTKRPARRRRYRTLSRTLTSLTLPFKKLRRDSPLNEAVEESIEMSSSPSKSNI